MRPVTLFARVAPLALALCSLGFGSTAHAFESFAFLVPCRAIETNSVGTERPCITCHNNADGGGGCAMPPCFNGFGTAFSANGRVWNEALASLDSDGDGFTNGEELGDPAGAWRPSMGTPSYCACASRPGSVSYTPADADLDMDGYCCLGQDLSSPPNGTCRDSGERTSGFDCDDANASAYSGTPEVCTNLADDDCDGLPTLDDSDCANVVDRDGDGFCVMGRDVNGDRNCIGAGEATAASDCDDDAATVYPGAGENCVDELDNDCDGFTDRADPTCRSDVDADRDGFCPIGRDLDGNGDCNGTGEPEAGLDCNDANAAVNSGAGELCGDGADNDCDGPADFRDSDCGTAYDFDGDGYCLIGRDVNDDRYCTAAEELVGPIDCDDTNRMVYPGATEMCTTSTDADCDALVSIEDPDCDRYRDLDGDRYCPVGFDMNRNGNCLDVGEETGNGDCLDTDGSINPAIVEVCTDGLDNDCDEVPDALDRGDCRLYVDHDLDGWCRVGRDSNDDGDCADPGEQGELTEVPTTRDPELGTDLDPTVYPTAPENCLDRKDNDLNGVIDDADRCTRERDADGDGFCAIGRDANGDGDCLDTDENYAVSDCDDDDAEVNPDAEEMCRGIVDLDCDGNWGQLDEDCFYLLDQDGDGFCPMGIDDNGDRDCDDEGEDRFGADCADDVPTTFPGARELCDNDADEDCDGLVDFADPQCACTEVAQCDDGDPCTTDACAASVCTWTPDPSCGDASVTPDAGMGGGGGGTTGCNCRAAGGGPRSTGWLGTAGWIGLALLVTLRRRRRSR